MNVGNGASHWPPHRLGGGVGVTRGGAESGRIFPHPALSHAQRERVTTSGSAWLIGHDGADGHHGLFSHQSTTSFLTFFLEYGLNRNFTKKYCASLLILFAVLTSRPASAATNDFKVIQFKQGCSILCPGELQALDSANIERIDKYITETADKLRPKLTFRPNAGTTLLAAVDNKSAPTRQLLLTLGPPEISQDELKAFTPKQRKGLADAMFRQMRPIFAQTGINVTKELDSKVLNGAYLKCFLLAYEFTDETKVPQISFRTCYYTKSATFVITYSCEKDYYFKNRESVKKVLESLNNSGD
ncbi:hypothetical protein [Pedosphaera parvula]|uniref:Uncharacterized protein n=1 Tax=Pedosphaera parvula (strain Ellin514) TaxID=320771 RepID=B9XER5_PEDPL|nr:hypothetical protein [Pedosphaera parvula]EEF61779.1 hypothetical protein Cflav_PD4819 [Pedosphaera parvula Ellin514]